MNFSLRKSGERGHADHDWLNSRHTFSFADYHDPRHMGFRSLRVINQDMVAPGAGFPMHAHHDMEIFSYVLEGELEHKDSMGNRRRLQAGDIQLMSAGRGVSHSEYNPSAQVPTHFLQIWITPSETGLPPSYTELRPSNDAHESGRVLLISPSGKDDSAVIHQDVEIWRVRLKPGESASHQLAAGRGLWIQMIKGDVLIDDFELCDGDSASTEDAGSSVMTARKNSELLLFDLA